jgi:hypothetical protein
MQQNLYSAVGEGGNAYEQGAAILSDPEISTLSFRTLKKKKKKKKEDRN